MFDPDGRHFKTMAGKDYIDHLLAGCEAGMIQVGLDAEIRLAQGQNRLTSVEGRVDLVRQDVLQANQRINVVAARAAEDADASVNER